MAELTGGSEYDWNIANCNPTMISIGDLLLMEPGSMVGPDELRHRRPDRAGPERPLGRPARRSATNIPSPRVTTIPVFDPVYYATG